MSLSFTRAEKDAAAYTLCLGSHRKLIITACLLKFSKTNNKLNNIHSENRKINILIKIPFGPFSHDVAHITFQLLLKHFSIDVTEITQEVSSQGLLSCLFTSPRLTRPPP